MRHAESCLAVVRLLNARSKYAVDWDPQVLGDDMLLALRELADLESVETELPLVLHELQRVDLIRSHPDPNSQFGIIGPADDFFWKTDPLFQAWHPRRDARELCARALASDSPLTFRAVDEELAWGPRRLNPAVAFMKAHNLVDDMGAMMDHPYLVHSARPTVEARFFLEEP